MHISFLSFDFLIFIKEVFYCCFNLTKEYTLFGHSSVTVVGFSYKIFYNSQKLIICSVYKQEQMFYIILKTLF